ncbi:hypothetical protein [Methylophilus sp. OH31]|uniref:hypothetical protein n=1 Tax=Methylophilus sp. OH31 TaxID=1387312 RepID=UPI000463CC89|nr:hypothetical protein [Methylophilus sp. OH31]
MPVNPKELQSSAIDIKSKCNATEADFRGSISRAYYACYHGANEFHGKLTQPGVQKPNCGVHENLQHMLDHPTLPNTDPDYKKSKLVAHFLKGQLFCRRNVDYKLDLTITQRDVDVVFANTNEIFQII